MAIEAATHDPYGPFVTRTRTEWARLSSTLPVQVTAEMVRAARSSQDTIDVEQVRQVYAPLTELISLYVQHTGGLYATTHDFLDLRDHRTPFVIGVAGSVSVGKSTTSRLLKALLAQTPGHPRVDLVTTDGFLYPNAVLEERGLMGRKGFPESYDRRALLDFVMAVKSGEPRVEAPVYSHQVYDVVPDHSVVVDRPDVLVLEGLNVLQAAPRGSRSGRAHGVLAVSDFIDFSIYVDADPRDIRRWYLDRFLTLKRTAFTGKDSYFRRFADIPDDVALAGADEIWESVNLVNLRENIEPTRGRATLVLRKGPDHHMREVLLRKS